MGLWPQVHVIVIAYRTQYIFERKNILYISRFMLQYLESAHLLHDLHHINIVGHLLHAVQLVSIVANLLVQLGQRTGRFLGSSTLRVGTREQRFQFVGLLVDVGQLGLQLPAMIATGCQTFGQLDHLGFAILVPQLQRSIADAQQAGFGLDGNEFVEGRIEVAGHLGQIEAEQTQTGGLFVICTENGE